jgi:cell division protein FtsQ|nr:FtsQ-type POTRA domain-containing protein [Kofleriaceae bacterium]
MRARKNRRRAPSLWSRLPPPRAMADVCGRALRRSLPALAGTAALSALVAGGWCAYHFVTTSPRFAITDIEIRGTSHESPEALIGKLPIQIGDNAFSDSTDDVAASLLADPWIAGADAHRVLPHTLVIDVREHAPVALADLDGLYLVDAAGRPFKRADLAAGDGAGLPVVTGLPRAAYAADPDGTAHAIAGALGTLDTWRAPPCQDPDRSALCRAGAERPAIGEIHVDPRGELTLRTYEGGVAIQLGSPGNDLAARLDTFDAAWAELGDAERARARAVHVDTQPDHVTIAFN